MAFRQAPSGSHHTPLVGLVLLFGLGLYQLGADSLWYDEAASAWAALADPAEAVRWLVSADVHPPLYSLLLHYWTTLAGHTEFALRWPSLALAMLALTTIVRLLTDALGRRPAVAVGLLLAVNPFVVQYAREARMYSLALLWSALSLFFTLRLLRGTGRADIWLGYLAVGVLGIYTHYYLFFVLVGEGVVLLIACRRRPRYPLRLGMCAAAIAALYFPWLPSLIVQLGLSQPGAWRPPMGVLEAAAQSVLVFALGETVDPALEIWTWGIGALAIVLAGYGCLRAWQRREGWAVLAVVAGLLIPLGLVELASIPSPLFFRRYVLVFLPAWSLALGLGIVAARPMVARSAMFVLFAGQALSLHQLYFNPQLQRDDYRSAASTLMREWRAGDALLLDNGRIYPAYAWYAGKQPSWHGRITDPAPPARPDAVHVFQIGTVVPGGQAESGPSPELSSLTSSQLFARLAALIDEYDRLWLLRAYSPGGESLGWLRQHASQQYERWLPGATYVQLYRFGTHRPTAALPDAVQRVDQAAFANGAKLAAFRLPSDHFTGGQQVKVTLFWEVERPVTDFQVFVRLIDESGRALTQTDGPPFGGALPPSDWAPGTFVPDDQQVRIPLEISTGAYRLQVGMHPPGSSEPSPLTDGRTALDLGRVWVSGSAPEPTSHIADFEGGAELVGAALGETRQTGAAFDVTLSWRTSARLPADYKVFVHLYDAHGRLAAQHDGPPANGNAPTSFWRVGDVIADRHEFGLPPPGPYRLAVGLYDTAGRRLSVDGSPADAVEVGMLEVLP